MIPNFTVFSPANTDELRSCLKRALYETKGPVAVRYPRGQSTIHNAQSTIHNDYKLHKRNSDKLTITYGRLANHEYNTDVLQLIKIQPLPDEAVNIALNYREVTFIEEGIKNGGVGEQFAYKLLTRSWSGKYELKAINSFIPQAEVGAQISKLLS